MLAAGGLDLLDRESDVGKAIWSLVDEYIENAKDGLPEAVLTRTAQMAAMSGFMARQYEHELLLFGTIPAETSRENNSRRKQRLEVQKSFSMARRAHDDACKSLGIEVTRGRGIGGLNSMADEMEAYGVEMPDDWNSP